jgi:phage gp45-like
MENLDATVGHLRRASIVSVDDSGDQQLVNLTGLSSEQMAKIVRVLPHGFGSNPPAGAEGIFKSLGGRADRGMFIGGEYSKVRQRNLSSGNAVLYDDQGNVVWMKSSLGILAKTAQGDIKFRPADGKKVYLGGDPAEGHVFAKVQTESGPSPFVFARIG